MTNELPWPLAETLLRLARESSRRSSELHRQFLSQRTVSLRGIQSLIELQARAAGRGGTAAEDRPCVFTSAQLDAFGTGKISDCFGPAFARYDARRMPRIPNGDLKMMSRVTAISGGPADSAHPAAIAVEYDVPESCWYLRDQAGPDLPFALLMETALQPCGFLMAYLDNFASLPPGEYFFRNLDGWIEVDRRHAIAGQRILTRARLLSSVLSGDVLMQKLAFELTCGGAPFCHGETLFGYFSAAAMAAQVGLDGGRPTPSWMDQHPALPGTWVNLERQRQARPGQERLRLADGRLKLLDRVFTQPGGGRYGRGYAYGRRALQPDDWFYPFHFYQDPVMPGSLGVEAILQAMQSFALENGLGAALPAPYFGLAEKVRTEWRYRGQIVQSHQKMEVEVHINSVQTGPSGLILTGDASLWADGLRIYEVKNAAIGMYAG